MSVCDCDEEFGPCEQHCEVLAQREGASARTADELCAVFLLDAHGLGADVSEEDLALAGRVEGWIDDDTGQTQDALADAVLRAECSMPEGVQVFWDDGYRIVRVTA